MGKITNINLDYLTHKPKIEIQLNSQQELFTDEFDKIKDDNLDIEIKKHYEKRSLNANSYLWVLCDKIAKEVGITKEKVYKDFIKEIGEFEIIPIKKESVEKFKISWGKNGLGWLCEIIGDSKIKGYTNVMAYYGSSVYNSKTMAILLDKVIEQAKELGLQTLTNEELKSLIKGG
jgi:hypothetical protein